MFKYFFHFMCLVIPVRVMLEKYMSYILPSSPGFLSVAHIVRQFISRRTFECGPFGWRSGNSLPAECHVSWATRGLCLFINLPISGSMSHSFRFTATCSIITRFDHCGPVPNAVLIPRSLWQLLVSNEEEMGLAKLPVGNMQERVKNCEIPFYVQ
jgi:hypothetical protein